MLAKADGDQNVLLYATERSAIWEYFDDFLLRMRALTQN